MAGGNAPKLPPPSSSAQSHQNKSRWESSSSAAATDHKLSGSASTSIAESKSKSKHSHNPGKDRTPTTTSATPNKSKEANNKPPTPTPKPKPRSEIPLRPENPNAHFGPPPVFPFPDQPPPPAYGFHMLDRRTIVLADGSVRSYFALPPDYANFMPMLRPGFRPELRGPPEFGLDRSHFPMNPDFLPEFRPEFRGPDDPLARTRNQEYWNSLGPGPESSLKRKFGEEERRGNDAFERQPQHALQYRITSTNANGPGPSGLDNLGRGEEMRPTKYMKTGEVNVGKLKHNDVDQNSLRKAFSHFVKLIYENANQKRNYLADGKQGPLQCLACGRTSKDYPDMHSLIMHMYNSDSGNLLVDHLGFHKALCILMGWNHLMPPDNSKAYQMLSSDEAIANQDDLILWPPSVLIHNTLTGKGRDGRMEGIGNRPMDSILGDLGFSSGKSMSLFSREGHLGIHVVKFPGGAKGLKEALRLAEHFEKQNRGRKDWARVQSSPTFNKEDDNNPNLVKLDATTGEKKRIFYGHIATVSDLDKVTFEIKKKVTIESKRDYKKHSK
ncbi:uncharacterized protein LOC111403089 [Olea europaea var. sylvestris]|uniref:uncharacterized protein LOC111403089 n=1 Tax=Olea europaea var. sylvestris TaxID=158386 RepID=UPI000C1CEFC1|nr:uncharacterized protein LOC111403089 [Olea europaea var. sylvestris]